MFTVYNGYSVIKLFGNHTFFAGANTDKGFVSSYDTIADEKQLERVYVIKGGSGCGKSTLMYNIAKRAEKNGFFVDYYLCGSDPDSLDCIVLDKRIAVLDGTYPHVREPYLVGASSEIVDMTVFIDDTVLEAKREELYFLTNAKKSAYSGAYQLLGAAGLVNKAMVSLASEMYLYDKADAFMSRLISRLPKSKNDGEITAKYYSHAFTMKGMVCTPSLTNASDVSYNVIDTMNTAQIFMHRLSEKLVKYGQKTVITALPMSDAISGIYLSEHRISITVGEKREDGRNINLMRFIDSEKMKHEKGRMKLYSNILESAEKEAMTQLSLAKEAHFAVEKIYSTAIDYERLEKYGNSVSHTIVKRLRTHA